METKLKNYLSVIILMVSIIFFGILSSNSFIFGKNEKANVTEKAGEAVKIKNPKGKPLKVTARQVRRIKYVAPLYPVEALKAKVSGNVRVALTVGIDGKVKKYKVINGHPLLRNSAVNAMKQWEYEPKIKDKNPIGFIVTGCVTFKNQ